MTNRHTKPILIAFYAAILALFVGFSVYLSPDQVQASPPPPPSKPTAIVVDEAAVTATADQPILGTGLTPSDRYPSVSYEISVACITTGAVFRVTENDGSTTRKYAFNGPTGALTADCAYTFTWGGSSAYTYNFEAGTTTTVKLLVQERQE